MTTTPTITRTIATAIGQGLAVMVLCILGWALAMSSGCTTAPAGTNWAQIARTSGKVAAISWRIAAKPTPAQQCEVSYICSLVGGFGAGLTNLTTFGESVAPEAARLILADPRIPEADRQVIADGVAIVLLTGDVYLSQHPEWQTYADKIGYLTTFAAGAQSVFPPCQ